MRADRGEVLTAFIWLCLGASLSLLLEVVYLRSTFSVGTGHDIPFPVSIVIAFGFNMVLTKTARLWTLNMWVGLIPLGVWLVGFMALLFAIDIPQVSTLRFDVLTVALCGAGLLGGVWPFFKKK